MLEEHLLPFLALLRERRYGIATIRTCRKVVCEFLVFLEGRIGRPEEITLDHWLGYFGIRSRLSSHLRERTLAPGYEKQCRNDLNLFLRYLVTKGIQTKIPLRQKKDLRAVPGYEDLLTRYERFLREHRGLKFKTINRLVDDANRLCRKMVETKVESWDALTPDVLYEHLRAEAQKLGYVALSHAQSALRSFFRFLRLSGECQKELDRYLVRSRKFRLSRIPPTVPLEDLERAFDDMKENTRMDIRDRAVLLLLTLYGLRPIEIARLKMDDVAWREGKIVFQNRKAGRDLFLPLYPAVARAPLEYVDQVRPRGTPYREIFLIKWPPHHPFRIGHDVVSPLQDRLERLGLHFRPYDLRHTLATRLINNDCPPEWIQRLLGHARFESTRVYAKVDMAHLREVAENDAVDL